MAVILRPDICVIGAGSGGLSVAAEAARFGVDVVVVEKGALGGDRLTFGCVASQALLAAGRQANAMRHASRFGIDDETPVIDFSAVNRHVHDVIASIAPNDSAARFAALGVRVIRAAGRFKDTRTVVAGDTEIRARRFVIATGSSPIVPPIEGLGDVPYLTTETIFSLARRPAHLIVIGGGTVGVELAQAHRRLGSRVTVIDRARLLAAEDPEMVALVRRALRDDGVDLREDTTVLRIEKRNRSGLRVHVSRGDSQEVVDGTHLLLAVGQTANTAGLELEKARISYDGKGLIVSDAMRTTNRRVYAIGDVAGGPRFTHLANHQAGLVVGAIVFRRRPPEGKTLIPRVVFSDPEIAQVGMTEAEARAARLKPRILRWPFAENDRAQAERRTAGHIKLIVDARETVLGVSIVGAGASEMIGFWALAMARKTRLRDLAGLVLPYPTMGEIGKRAAITYFSDDARKPLVRALIRLLRIFG